MLPVLVSLILSLTSPNFGYLPSDSREPSFGSWILETTIHQLAVYTGFHLTFSLGDKEKRSWSSSFYLVFTIESTERYIWGAGNEHSRVTQPGLSLCISAFSLQHYKGRDAFRAAMYLLNGMAAKRNFN